jgi:uncharacterized phage protein gp47/JayE
MSFINEDGLKVKRLQEIINDSGKGLKDNLNQDIDMTEESVLGTMNSVFGTQLSLTWEFLEDVYNAFNIRTAEGFQLDNLVLLNGLTRNAATATQGLVQCTGILNTVIPASSYVSQIKGTIYKTAATLALSPTSCVGLTLNAENEDTDGEILVTLDGATYSKPVIGGDTASAIIELAAQINDPINAQLSNHEAILYDDFPLKITFQTKRSSTLSPIRMSYSSDFEVETVVGQAIASSVEIGAFETPADVVNIIGSPVDGWYSVINYESFTLGSDEETDEQLRARYYGSITTGNTGTLDAIYAALVALAGVNTVDILHNETEFDYTVLPIPPEDTEFVDPLPPHSFECIIEGTATDEEIASTILNTKPLGIQTYSSTGYSATVIDAQGNPYRVFFTKPLVQYVHFQVIYTAQQGVFITPAQESDAMTSVLAYGDSLSAGQDVIHQSVIAAVYSAIPVGLASVQVLLGLTVDPLADEPDSWVEDSLVIAPDESTDWDILHGDVREATLL